jgi:hypothetical protein
MSISDISNPGVKRSAAAILFRLRLVLALFMLALVLSGLTAFPLQRELEAVTSARGLDHAATAAGHSGLEAWLLRVRDGLRDVYARYPWMAYGTDWLAFAHLVIAVFFVGPLVNPARNVWVLWAGLISCALVVALALICGPIRQIPFGWRLIDCSFGLFGAIPLGYCLILTRRLEKTT